MSILSVLVLPLVLQPACAAIEDSGVSSSEGERDVPVVGVLTEALAQPIETITLNLTADTSVRASARNKNFGRANALDINRGLVIVDDAALQNAMPDYGDYVLSAKLRLKLVPSGTRRRQRNLGAHRVLKPWTELGATWNCAVDSNTSNTSANCAGSTKWSMSSPIDAFVTTATGMAVVPASRTGVVEIDVTADVREFEDRQLDNYGWLLKTAFGDSSEVADIASRESSTPPQLVLSVLRCNLEICDDGITCSQDNLCDITGECIHLPGYPITPCDDANACTVEDHCSGTSDFECIPGTPAPEGTACGSGLACNATGDCVPTP